MSEIENQETENPEVESQETDIETKEIEDIEEEKTDAEKEVEEKENLVTRLINKVMGKKEEEENEEEGDFLPDSFVEAARKAGMTDEEIIETSSDFSDEELEEMASLLAEMGTEESLEESEELPEKETEEVKEVSKEDASELAKIKQELDNLKKELGKVKEDETEKFLIDLEDYANKAFDEASKDFEVFGLTKDLPKFTSGPNKGKYLPLSPAFQARSQVYDVYLKFVQLGQEKEDAMKNALAWYKGLNLEKDVERKAIQRLKKNEKRLSAKHQDKDLVREYVDEDEAKADIVRQIAAKAGVKMD